MASYVLARMMFFRVVIFVGILAAVSCGIRGRPLAPLVFVPQAVTIFSAERFDSKVYVELQIPSENVDATTPADLDRVDVYALTSQPVPGEPNFFVLDDWLEHATVVASIEVAEDPKDSSGSVKADGPTGVVEQGADITLIERLTSETMVPLQFDFAHQDLDVALVEQEVRTGPFVSPPLPLVPVRTYMAISFSSQGIASQISERIEVSLAKPTTAPYSPSVSYTESEVNIQWAAPLGARFSIQEPAMDHILPSNPIVEPAVATRYLVYEVIRDADSQVTGRSQLLNIQPVSGLTYVDPVVIFGEERCYAVRALDVIGSLEVRGLESPPTCVAPIDRFSPEPPTGLIAVASRDVISLVWNPSPEADLAGYLVLRAESPGATLEPLTKEPILETTYSDITVEANNRYVYAVQAVDNAVPPNVSEPSTDVVELAR